MKMFDLDFIHLYFDDGNAGEGGDAGKAGEGTPPANPAQPPKKEDPKPTEQKGSGDGADDERNKPKYSDADLDKIIEKKFAKWKKQQEAAVDEATRLANMTAQERAEHERDKLKKELDDLKKANVAAEMEKTARSILQTDGVTVPDTLVTPLVADSADATSENVKAFSKAFKEAVQKAAADLVSHKTPSAGSHSTMTASDIRKVKNTAERQKLMRENIALFGKEKK